KQTQHSSGYNPHYSNSKFPKPKAVRNAEITREIEEEEDEDEEEGETEEEDEEPIDFEELDLMVAGTDKQVCFNCQQIGHWMRNCPKPKKLKGKTTLKFKRKPQDHKVDQLAKDIRNLDIEERETLLDHFEAEGFH